MHSSGDTIAIATLNGLSKRGCGVPPQKEFYLFTPFGSQIGLLYLLLKQQVK
uniref:Uncharacterized protein n=1 Tax=Cyanothece sp. (strain PCC 7425 / ATCC 29141) TaxID=395961 RepID=B8HKL7_CYAP4